MSEKKDILRYNGIDSEGLVSLSKLVDADNDVWVTLEPSEYPKWYEDLIDTGLIYLDETTEELKAVTVLNENRKSFIEFKGHSLYL